MGQNPQFELKVMNVNYLPVIKGFLLTIFL